MKTAKKIKIMFLMTSCRKCGPVEQTLNIIKNLDNEKFEPILVTIYDERDTSRLQDFLPYVSHHYSVRMNKKSIILGQTSKMQNFLQKVQPDIVHSVGVFPNYLISQIGFRSHIFTLRNYAYDDYPDKFGKLRGLILAKMQMKAIGKTATVVSCSKSLQEMYQQKLGISTHCVQNGINIKKYEIFSKTRRTELRQKLGIGEKDFVWVYSGQFIGRKNIPFMIDGFLKSDYADDKLLLLGDGDDFDEIKNRYTDRKNLIFVGDVKNVAEYLNVGDAYISASKSEGLPNSVLEAMACGLPVLLSDIPQHKEILSNAEKSGGLTFKLNNTNNYVVRINAFRNMNLNQIAKNARNSVKENFNSVMMSQKYQKIYNDILQKKVTLFIGSLSGGGAERVTCNLANYLYDNGFNVDVITMSEAKNAYRLGAGVNYVCLLDNKDRSNKIKDFLKREKRLKRYVIKNQNVSCYVVMLPVTIFMLVRLKRFTKSKFIISERVNPTSHTLLNRILMKYSVKKSDGLVVQTEEIGDYYVDTKEKIVIQNALNEDVKLPIRKKVSNKIVSVGRLEKQKNYPMLIEAFGVLVKKHPEYILEIYGNGSLKNELVRLANECGLSDMIRFRDFTQGLSKEICDAKCFVMTSNYEGISNALIEAMCMGLPCIATDCDGGGAKSLIRNGKNGILIQKDSVNELVDAMNRIVEDNDLSERLSKEAIKLRDSLGHGKIYARWQTFIERVSEVA